MDGNTRFELTSASPDSSFSGNYEGGQRGYTASTLGRSSSFRDGAESRNFGPGKANSRGSASSSGGAPSLSQRLMLGPIPFGDPKHVRSSELRRVLSFPVGGGLEDNSFLGTAKSSSPLAVEELKRLRAGFADNCDKASARVKKLDEHLNKLNKYFEAMPSKKQLQRNEMLTNERSSGSTLKIGSQIPRNPSELGTQKLEDRSKNVGLNKRLRTSVAENRAECRSNGVLRQPLMVRKERDVSKDSNAESDIDEGKIRRLPAGGEGWDKKMKRKRSVGAVVSRSVDNNGELKRSMHHKLTIESNMQSTDSAHGFRSGASGASNKLDTTPTSGSTARTTLKNEPEKPMLSRELSGGPIKERTIGKVNIKLSNHEDNRAMSPSSIVKGKASRAPRSGSTVAANSAANGPRNSVTLESWEQPEGTNRTPSIGGANNRKRAMPSSPPITQWVGQRPQKISRTRRTNLIPVPNLDEVQTQPESCSPSDFGARISVGVTNASLLLKNAPNENQISKIKPENVPSPARLSESEESGAGENRINEKGMSSGDVEERAANAGQSVGSATIPIKKNKLMSKEGIGDGVRRQGRTGRVSHFSRDSVSPTRERLENAIPTDKPIRNARSSSDKNGKNGSKSGRPLKKLSDRKSFSRLGQMAHGGSPDCSGESDDDREELLAAANLACSSSFNACLSAFWKTVEALFASVGPDEKSYLSKELELAEKSCANSTQWNHGNFVQDHYGNGEMAGSDTHSDRRNGCIENELKDSSVRMEFVEQLQNSSLHECSDAEKRFNIVTPLCQRVLSALIMEDEIEEFEETGFGKARSSSDPCHFIGTESKHMDRQDLSEPIYDVQTLKNGNMHVMFSCNGNMDTDRTASAQDRLCNGGLMQRDSGHVHSEAEMLGRLSRCDYFPESLQSNNGAVSSFVCQYEQMSLEEKLVLELQSIGLFLEAVPALDDKEDDDINQEIAQLEMGLHEQIGKKRTCLEKLYKAIQDEKNTERDPEQVAMAKLVELSYKKLLATRGSFASKHGIAKVSKQVALTFVKRTLARCQKFEEHGTSCFSEPALREIIYAPPPRFNQTELLAGVSPTLANGTSFHQPDQARNGPTSNRGKNKEVLLDDVGGAVFRASSALGVSGGAKGKRSERDTSNRNSKTGKLTMGGSKGDRKTKSKPKQKTAQLSTAGITLVNNQFTDTTNSGEPVNNSASRRKDVRFMSSGNASKESMDLANLPLNDLDGIEELGLDSEIGEPQDINSWLNFDDVDGLQDHDLVGLDIPPDDLSDFNFF